jgi:hypothetical protein
VCQYVNIRSYRHTPVKTAIYTNTQRAIVKKNHKHLKTHNAVVISNDKKKNYFFEQLFGANQYTFYNNSTGPAVCTSLITQLNFNNFISSRNNEPLFLVTQKILKNYRAVTNAEIATTPSLASRQLKNRPHESYITNYTPLSFFNNRVSPMMQTNAFSRTRQYYKMLNVVRVTRYASFFAFYLLNFLENFLKKKL